jgi:hypothetical protein
MQQATIPILSDTLRSEELYQVLARSDREAYLRLVPNEQLTRSSLADPTVVAALIGAGATTLAALVSLIGVVWSTVRKSTGPPVIIEIRLDSSDLPKRTVEGVELDSGVIRIPLASAESIEEKGNPYAKVLAEIAPEQVQHIAIMEDE